MSHTAKDSLTRRELLKTAARATAVVVASPLVELAFGGDGALSAQALSPAAFNAAAGPDRVVMRQGKTYLNVWIGVGPQPRRQRLPGGPPPQAAPPPPPQPGLAPAVAWSQVSGPGPVTFADPKAAVTTALFSAPGEYVVQMAADNGTAKATSTLIVKVELPPPPEQLRFVVTRPYAVTGPFWASRVEALITSWIPYCIGQSGPSMTPIPLPWPRMVVSPMKTTDPVSDWTPHHPPPPFPGSTVPSPCSGYDLAMKTVGIIGGIGPESTIEYYRLIIASYRERARDGSYPSIVINSIDVNQMLGLIGANRLPEVEEYLAEELQRLVRAGADFAALAANTPHIVFGALCARSPVPLISIVDVTCEAARGHGLKRVGLFGTRFTMQAGFYPEALDRAGITVVLPSPEAQVYIHDKYMGELVRAIFLPETRDDLLAIVEGMKAQDGIEGLILGGTELPLLLRADDYAGVRFLDTTKLHAEAIVSRLLS